MESRFFFRLGSLILRLRWLVLAIVLLISALFVGRLDEIRFDTSNEAWLLEGDDTLELILLAAGLYARLRART